MNVLIVGGAGYVGSIIRSSLEEAHCCRHLDLRPVPGAEGRTIVGDVNDPEVVAEAVRDQQAVIYLAMGTTNGDVRTVGDIDAAFGVNVRGFYRLLTHALEAGVQRVCLSSSLSVYSRPARYTLLDETCPPDNWQAYGMSKRLAEFICRAAAQRYPQASILALRLIHPRNEADWLALATRETQVPLIHTGPQDTRRLFLDALKFDRPGYHVVQATGDTTDRRMPNHRVRELLGWSPQGR
jgi:nucleoside-diphosphate-sugar epimerase